MKRGRFFTNFIAAVVMAFLLKGKMVFQILPQKQIDSYHAAALIGIDPRNHAVAKKMSSDQIDQIITFLRLRKIDQ